MKVRAWVHPIMAAPLAGWADFQSKRHAKMSDSQKQAFVYIIIR